MAQAVSGHGSCVCVIPCLTSEPSEVDAIAHLWVDGPIDAYLASHHAKWLARNGHGRSGTSESAGSSTQARASDSAIGCPAQAKCAAGMLPHGVPHDQTALQLCVLLCHRYMSLLLYMDAYGIRQGARCTLA